MSYFEFCGVSCRAAFLTPFGGKIFLFYVFTGILFSVQPPAAISFLYYVFTSRVLHNTTSGGSIFRCTTKDRGERRAKGVATPFNPPELMRDRKPDVLWLYLLATVRLTRLSRLRRCRLFPCLCVLRCGGMVCTSATTRLPSLQNLGYSTSANNFTALGAPQGYFFRRC